MLRVLIPKSLKECIDCKRHLLLNKFRVRKTEYRDNYIVAKCRECERQYNKTHHDKEHKKTTRKRSLLNLENRERKNDYQRKWRKKNIFKNRNYHKKNIKKNVDCLTDSYVSRTMYKIRSGIDVPDKLIQAKRLQLKLKRLIKQRTHDKSNPHRTL